MRDNIIKKRVRADEVQIAKGPTVNRELQKLQQSNGVEQVQQEESTDWNTNDLSGDYLNDSYTCPSCFKKFDRKAVYTSHVQACSDAKCREKEMSKKRKAKEETKMKRLLEFEENSNASEQSAETPVPAPSTVEVDVNVVNKRKRKKAIKVKKEEPEIKPKLVVAKEDSNSVDWNLDDEEEKKKIDNIKKEIIEDEYKRVHVSANNTSEASTSKARIDSEPTHDDDDDDNQLVIDEKPMTEDTAPVKEMKCPQCEKVFDTNEKLKGHLNTYHSRQKRFKCKMCEYQGYRKKDTINHLDYVHKINGDKETLEKYMESVMKAVDEESLAKQNELKKTQLKIKRKMARERIKLNGSAKEETAVTTTDSVPMDSTAPTVKVEPLVEKSEFKEPNAVPQHTESDVKPPKIRRKSLHTSILIPPETNDTTDDVKKIPKMFIKAKVEGGSEEKKKKSHKKRDSGSSTGSISPQAGQSLLAISKFGKIVKRSSNGDSKEGSAQRPIRNRIKPVRKDFLYDLSDLLKKDADAYREQVIQSTTVGFKRELRKRAMSTSTRDAPELSSFDDSEEFADRHSFLMPPTTPSKDDDDIPLVKFKDQRNRRMSVFSPPARPMYPAAPRSPVYKPIPEPTPSKPNAGAAYRMAMKEFDANRASMYEPKFLWTVCFDREPKRPSPIVTSTAFNTPTTSAAASILQKLSGRVDDSYKQFAANISKSRSVEEKSTKTMSAEQLCKSFDMINVTSISEGEFDIPESRAINLNPCGNGLVALALEEAGNDVCVLQECNPDSDEDDDDEEEEDDSEKPSSSSATVSDAEPKKVPAKKRAEGRAKRTKKNSEKRKSGANSQRRLTVMQRLQENKIRKSREQLFKRLIMDRPNEDENPTSPVYNLFSES